MSNAATKANQYRMYAEQWFPTHTNSMTHYYKTFEEARASALDIAKCGYEVKITDTKHNTVTVPAQ